MPEGVGASSEPRTAGALCEMREARDIHQQWVRSFEDCPYGGGETCHACRRSIEFVGTKETHQKWVERYDGWIKLLEALLPSPAVAQARERLLELAAEIRGAPGEKRTLTLDGIVLADQLESIARSVRVVEQQSGTEGEREFGSLSLSSKEARRAVAALIDVGHGSPKPRPPDPYAKALADRLLARRISPESPEHQPDDARTIEALRAELADSAHREVAAKHRINDLEAALTGLLDPKTDLKVAWDRARACMGV